MTASVITISASVGAGGSLVGPAVADGLGLAFVDRVLPAAVAASLDVSLRQALAHDDKAPSVLARVLSKLGAASLPYGATPVPGDEPVFDEQVFRTKTEQVIQETASKEGAVILGRAAAVVLAGRPETLHVRLDGDREARIERVKARQSMDTVAATRFVDDGDRARETYVRHFYKADAHDARLYHLTIDSVVLPLETCAEMIIQAAKAIPPPGAAPASSTDPA